MDGPLEITTTLTLQDRIEASLWATHAAQPDRRRTNLVWSLIVILGGSAVGLLASWADEPASLAEFLSLAPAMLRTPYTVLIALLLATAIGRYVFDDWLLRRRVARWVLTEQGAEAVTFLYRVDASGLAAADKTAVIPPKANRRRQRPFDRDLYKTRHLIENFFAKLKQYRAIATRYDKTARNVLAAVHLAAAVTWLN